VTLCADAGGGGYPGMPSMMGMPGGAVSGYPGAAGGGGYPGFGGPMSSMMGGYGGYGMPAPAAAVGGGGTRVGPGGDKTGKPARWFYTLAA
jgi:hypothetical protein